MAIKNVNALKRGFSYRHATGGRGGLGLYSDGLLMAEYENYANEDEPVIIYGKNLTGVDQWFNEESETQNYAIGTKMVVEDMVFRYAHINAYRASAWRGRGMQNIGGQTSVNCSASGYLPVSAMTAASAAATSITVTIDNAYSATANEFENGEIYLESSPWSGAVRGRIRSNTATSTTTTFALKEGIVAATSTTPSGKLHWSPYAHTGTPKTDSIVAFRSSVVGCLNVNGTADYYVWLQTWGPYMSQYGSTDQQGEGKDHRSVYFDRYGAFIQGTTAGIDRQYAGFSLACTADTDATGSSGWSPWVMLQISP